MISEPHDLFVLKRPFTALEAAAFRHGFEPNNDWVQWRIVWFKESNYLDVRRRATELTIAVVWLMCKADDENCFRGLVMVNNENCGFPLPEARQMIGETIGTFLLGMDFTRANQIDW